MGRGIAYQYDHFMLFEESNFIMYPVDLNDEIIEGAEGEWDEDLFEDFLKEVAQTFSTSAEKRKHYEWVDRESYIFAETDRLKIGIDSGGGSPCIFVIPKSYYLFGDYRKEKHYVIDRDVIKAFNKLIDSYGKDNLGQSCMFRYPSSAWTSYGLTGYRANRIYEERKVG